MSSNISREELRLKFRILQQHYPQQKPYYTIEEIDMLPMEELLMRYENHIASLHQEKLLDEFKMNYTTLNLLLELIYTKLFRDESKVGMTMMETSNPITTLADGNARMRDKMTQLNHDYQAFMATRTMNISPPLGVVSEDAIILIVRSMLDRYEHGAEISELLRLFLDTMIEQYRSIGMETEASMFAMLKNGGAPMSHCNLL